MVLKGYELLIPGADWSVQTDAKIKTHYSLLVKINMECVLY